ACALYPRSRIGREPAPTRRVKSVDCTYQGLVALLDRVIPNGPLIAETGRDRDDETPVRLDHVLPRAEVASPHALRELALSFGSQHASRRGLFEQCFRAPILG